MFEKLKSFLADDALYMTVLVLLVGAVSFGLGRQSVLSGGERGFAAAQSAGIIFIDAPEAPMSIQSSVESNAQQVVVSRSGTKYHLHTCPGAAQIKEENKIYFDSVELAKAAGYTAAANCPGL